MASLHNSKSKGNLVNGAANAFVGGWEDVKEYTSVTSTITWGNLQGGDALPPDATVVLSLQWSPGTGTNNLATNPPVANTVPIAMDEFTFRQTDLDAAFMAISRQVDTRARWFRIKMTYNGVGATPADLTGVLISTVYKKQSTEIKLVDDTGSIVNVNHGGFNNSLSTVLTDNTGNPLGTSNAAGDALFTSLTDATGANLATTEHPARIEESNTDNYIYMSSTGKLGVLLVFNTTDIAVPINRLTTTRDFAGVNTYINVESNTFSLPKTSAIFREGDTVNFFVYTAGPTGTVPPPNNGPTAVSLSDLPLEDGAIFVQATVHITSTDAQFVNFQLLVSRDVSTWFDPSVGLTFSNTPSPQVLGAGTGYATQIKNNTYYLKTDYFPTVSNAARIPVDNYYALINEAEIDNHNYVQLFPGTYPLDLRLFSGSRGPYNPDPSIGISTSIRSAAIQLVQGVNDQETLLTGLRDHTGSNIYSTGIQEDTYIYNSSLFIKQRLQITFDATAKSSVYSGSLENVVQSFVGSTSNSLINKVQTLTGKLYGIDPGTQVPTASGFVVRANNLYGNDVSSGTTSYNTQYYKSNITLIKNGSGVFLNPTIAAPGKSPIADPNNPATFLDASTNFIVNPYKALTDMLSYTGKPDTMILVVGSINFVDMDYVGDGTDRYMSERFIKNYTELSGIKLFVVAPAPTDLNTSSATAKNWRILNELVGDPKNIITYANYSELISSAFLTKIANRITSVRHVAHNALAVHTSNAQGVSQASTATITAASTFPGVAMHYSLADYSGNIIDTTKLALARGVDENSTDLNGLYVTLNTPLRNAEGNVTGYASVSNQNPIYVSVKQQSAQTYSFDTSVGSTSIGSPVKITDTSGNKVNLSSIGFVNETPLPIWVKIYDICSGAINALKTDISNNGGFATDDQKSKALYCRLAGYDNLGETFNSSNNTIKLNLAVPPNGSRDLNLTYPIVFSTSGGIHMSASSNFRYNSSDFPIGPNQIYVHGTWNKVQTTNY